MRFATGTSQSVKDKFRARGGMDAEFLFFLAHFKAGRAALDDQRRDSFFALCRIGIYVNDGSVGHAAVGDPRLCAVDDVAVALAHCFGGERRCVRAGLRLGERVATDFFAAREGQQKFLFLLFGAEAVNRIAVQANFARKESRRWKRTRGKFLR